MKIKGRVIKGPNCETVVIPRGDDYIVFKTQAVLDYEPFEKMVPEPKPPAVLYRGETVSRPNFEDPKYREDLKKRNLLKYAWMCIKSLEATEDLEWEIVDKANPSTWNSLDEEFKKAGFTPLEINKIYEGVLTANGMNEEKLEQARKHFLATQAALQNR
jgi:hypothetical protein